RAAEDQKVAVDVGVKRQDRVREFDQLQGMEKKSADKRMVDSLRRRTDLITGREFAIVQKGKAQFADVRVFQPLQDCQELCVHRLDVVSTRRKTIFRVRHVFRDGRQVIDRNLELVLKEVRASTDRHHVPFFEGRKHLFGV